MPKDLQVQIWWLTISGYVPRDRVPAQRVLQSGHSLREQVNQLIPISNIRCVSFGELKNTFLILDLSAFEIRN